MAFQYISIVYCRVECEIPLQFSWSLFAKNNISFKGTIKDDNNNNNLLWRLGDESCLVVEDVDWIFYGELSEEETGA